MRLVACRGAVAVIVGEVAGVLFVTQLVDSRTRGILVLPPPVGHLGVVDVGGDRLGPRGDIVGDLGEPRFHVRDDLLEPFEFVDHRVALPALLDREARSLGPGVDDQSIRLAPRIICDLVGGSLGGQQCLAERFLGFAILGQPCPQPVGLGLGIGDLLLVLADGHDDLVEEVVDLVLGVPANGHAERLLLDVQRVERHTRSPPGTDLSERLIRMNGEPRTSAAEDRTDDLHGDDQHDRRQIDPHLAGRDARQDLPQGPEKGIHDHREEPPNLADRMV